MKEKKWKLKTAGYRSDGKMTMLLKCPQNSDFTQDNSVRVDGPCVLPCPWLYL